MTNSFDDATPQALAGLDALLSGHENNWWDSFYKNRAKPCPFFGTAPDENLPKWVNLEARALKPGGSFGLACFTPEG